MVLTVRLGIEEIREIAVKSLINRFGERLEAVVLFGSYARKKATELSDIDLFVVVHGLPKEPVKRRYIVYEAVAPALSGKFRHDVTVVEAEEIGKHLTPLLINIAHDGVILYDRRNKITALFSKIRDAVKRSGLTKYETSEGKYGWKLSKELSQGEVFEVKLEG